MFYSWTSPEGEYIEVRYVADGNGYQPESSALPVAPEFPHELPQFVLDQIDKARREDEARARGDLSREEYERPSNTYRSP